MILFSVPGACVTAIHIVPYFSRKLSAVQAVHASQGTSSKVGLAA